MRQPTGHICDSPLPSPLHPLKLFESNEEGEGVLNKLDQMGTGTAIPAPLPVPKTRIVRRLTAMMARPDGARDLTHNLTRYARLFRLDPRQLTDLITEVAA